MPAYNERSGLEGPMEAGRGRLRLSAVCEVLRGGWRYKEVDKIDAEVDVHRRRRKVALDEEERWMNRMGHARDTITLRIRIHE